MTRQTAGAIAAALLSAFVTAPSLSPARAQQPSQVPGTFRSAIALVPVDVRVFDKAGRSVQDLRQDDFTIFEDGVRQEIRHFSSQALVPAQPESENRDLIPTPPETRRPGAEDFPVHRRKSGAPIRLARIKRFGFNRLIRGTPFA